MNTTVSTKENMIELEDIYSEFGDVEASITKLQELNAPICSELGGCHLGTHIQ